MLPTCEKKIKIKPNQLIFYCGLKSKQVSGKKKKIRNKSFAKIFYDEILTQFYKIIRFLNEENPDFILRNLQHYL